MGASTGTILAATAISFGNEFVNSKQVNFRIPIAGFGVALILDGIEKISVQAALGLATIAFITVIFLPVNGKSPAETLADLSIAKGKVNKGPVIVQGAPGTPAVAGTPIASANGQILVK